MKKMLLLIAAVLIIVPAANAQVCLDFDAFCDGMTLTAGGGALNGTWDNYDCAGSSDELNGTLGGGIGRVLCGAGGAGTCFTGPDSDFGFALDGLDGTMDMFNDTGMGFVLFIDELEYTVNPPDCNLLSSDIAGGTSVSRGWDR